MTDGTLVRSAAERPLRSELATQVAGPDIFISYRRAEAWEYAAALCRQLEERGLECFFDRDDLAAGSYLDVCTRMARRSRMFVLIGTPTIFDSPHVAAELHAYHTAHARWPFRRWMRLVPINVGETLTSLESPSNEDAYRETPWAPLVGRISEKESPSAVADGVPSPHVVDSIEQAFTAVRSSSRLVLGSLAIAAAILLATLGIVLVLTLRANAALNAKDGQLNAKDGELQAKNGELLKRQRKLDSLNGQLVTANADLGKARDEATIERGRAAEARTELRREAANLDTAAAIRLVQDGRAAEALARLARALRTDPENVQARTLAFHLLLHRRWPLPVAVFPHDRSVREVFLTPDGARLVTFADAAVRIWDVRTTKVLHRIALDGDPWLLVPNPDGSIVFAFTHAGQGAVIDVHTGAVVGRLQVPKRPPVSAAFSANSEWFAFAPADEERCAMVTSPDQKRRYGPFCGHEGALASNSNGVAAVAFAADGTLYTGGDRFDAWEPATGKKIASCEGEGLRAIRGIWALRDGEVLIRTEMNAGLWRVTPSGCTELGKFGRQDRGASFTVYSEGVEPRSGAMVRGNTVFVWERSTEEGPFADPMAEPDADAVRRIEHQKMVTSVDFAPDGSRIGTAAVDGTALVSELTGAPLFEPLRHASGVYGMRFGSPSRVVTGAGDGEAVLWDVAERPAGGVPLLAGNRFEFSPDGSVVVDGGTLYDSRSGAILEHIPGTSVVTSMSSDRFATGTAEGVVRMWTFGGEPIGAPLRHDGRVRAVRFSDGGRLLITAEAGGRVRVFDVKTQREQRPFTFGKRIVDMDVRGDLVAIRGETELVLWNRASGTRRRLPLEKDDSASVRLSPSGDHVVTVAQNMVGCWDTHTLAPHWTHEHKGGWQRIHLSANGRHVVSAGRDEVRVLEISTGKTVGVALPVETATLAPMAALDPHGDRIAIPTTDGIRVYDLATGVLLTSIPQSGGILTMTFSPDGERLVVGSLRVPDLIARVWDVPRGSPADAAFLADVAELVGGYRLGESEQAVRIPPASRTMRRLRTMEPPAGLSESGRRAAAALLQMQR